MSRCCEPRPQSPSDSSRASHFASTNYLRIEQMDCPTEEKLIRDALSKQAGVGSVEFNLLNRTVKINHSPEALEAILAAIAALGMHAQVIDEQQGQPAPSTEAKPWWPLAVAGALALTSELAHYLAIGGDWLSASFAILAIALSGLNTYKKGWIALKNRNLNINALMSIAVTGALLIGQWPEAAMVMTLFALAELIEARSLERARHAISQLMELAPTQASVRQADGSWQEVDAQQVSIGALVRIKPGERIALDGVIRAGSSTVNQAPITGESLSVEKTVGDTLFAGTINETGALEMQVTAGANDSTLARIIQAVEAAQASRAPTQRFVDRFSQIYTPLVVLAAIVMAIAGPLLSSQPWLDWIYRALVLLVVACPCALVISTPVSIVSGLAAAARRGILVKGGVHLENGRHLQTLALDKTGTLTHGRPVQTDSLSLAGEPLETSERLAASLAARSDHPVSRAIAQSAQDKGLALDEVTTFEALLGRGVKGQINGQWLYLGNHRLVEELGLCSAELETQLQHLERQGKTVIVLCNPDRALALFAVADSVRQTSQEAIAQLHALGVRTVMLTGDNAHTAAAIAAQVGVDEARGDLLPEDKLHWIKAAQSQGQQVGMVGDGINDAPALAGAHIGFAMGAAGSDTAIETADVALMDDDLRKIPSFIRLSQRTARVLKQNIALALAVKAVFMVLTLSGDTTLWMAVFADMGVSLLVVFNGLRLLRFKG